MFLATPGFLTPQSSGFDPDALAYFTAAGITDTTEKDAVNQLVLDLKGTGSTTNNTNVWDDLYVVNPLSPTSLAAAAYNLKDPTRNITWFNSPTHATTGISGNGTNMYGNLGYNPLTEGWDESNIGLTYSGEYSNADFPLGCRVGVPFLALRNQLNTKGSYITSNSTVATSSTTLRNITTGSRTSNTSHKIFTNGVEISEITTTETEIMPNGDLFILGLNLNGSIFAAFAGEIDFTAVHKGLTDNQAKDLSDAITTYNTAAR